MTTQHCPLVRFRSFRQFLILAGILILCFTLTRFCRKQTDGFTITGISSNRPFNPAWQTHSLSPEEQEELNTALSQKYQYFNRGGQCYVFLSEDGNYVIKFFKQQTYTIPLWHHFIPIPYVFDLYKEKKQWKRQDKLSRDFLSYKASFDELQSMTGLVFVHLNRTQDLQRTLTVIDRLHIEHPLDLDQFDFVLQKRAQLISPAIAELVQHDQIPQAKQIIDQIAELIVDRCQKGLEDRDPEIRTNCGLLEGRVIKIDVGRLTPNEEMKTPAMCRSELIKIMGPFKEWLQPVDAQLAAYCDEAIEKALNDRNQAETALVQ